MKYLKQTILVGLIVLQACNGNKDDVVAKWTWDDTWKQFEQIDISSKAVSDIILRIPVAPFNYSVRIIAPESIDPNGNPLVFSLHGGVAGAGVDAHKSTQCSEPSLSKLNAFIISPNADNLQWYEEVNQIKIVDLITGANNTWNIDKAKLVVTGYSDGANGSWFYAELLPEIFSAAIAISSSYNTDLNETTGRKIDIPLYVIHSNADELFPLAQTQQWVDQSIAAGSQIEFVIAEGLSHNKPCDYLPYLDDASTWLLESVW